MTAPTIKWEFSIGTILHVIVLVVGLLVAYGQFITKNEENVRIIETVQGQTTRIEHYLSSKDPNYWKETNQ